MPKRKLSELSDTARAEPSHQNRKLHIQTERLTEKFNHGGFTLFRALKTARGFERQKLGRRQKTAQAQGDNQALERIEKEIAALKELDLHRTAEKHLLKQLIKTKRIAESPVFVQFKEGGKGRKISTEGPKDTAEANVTARLFKSNPIKNVLPDILGGIRNLLGVDGVAPARGGSGANDNERSTSQSQERKSAKAESIGCEKRDGGAITSTKDHDSASRPGEDVDMDDSGADSESVDYAQFDARLASSDEESEGEEEEEDAGAVSEDDIALSEADDPSIRTSQSPPPKKSKMKSTEPPKSTTFLPSLMMGGYWSGSESPSEDEEQPRRKNRMGQQARRALWEKKYGSRANHLQKEKQKQAESRNSRDSGWDLRKGATDPDDGDGRGRWGRGGGGKPQRRDAARGSGAVDFKRKDKAQTDNKPLHPSWEAARKAKEQATQASFQGKKITFD